jgi:hypothetical protein
LAALETELADAGRFTEGGRKAALRASLPLIASYFADAATWELEISAQLGSSRSDPVLEDFAAGARFRASLAAAERFLRIIADVTLRPTFRYSQVSSESVGSIRGRLDVARYTRERGRISIPTRYPIRVVEREAATPENILAAYAAIWLKRDLDLAPRHLVSPKSPEGRNLESTSVALSRVLALPTLAGTSDWANDIWRRGTLDELLDLVEQRLAGGHVANPVSYQELFDWMKSAVGGTPIADVGEVEWSFYGPEFDTKLFEIWSCVQLAAAISELIGDPASGVPSLAKRGVDPLYQWNLGIGSLQLHFQPSLATLAVEGQVWRFTESDRPLQGFPDIAVTTSTIIGTGLAIFDPKLRQRRNAPAEEIYKLLGYFGNLKGDRRPMGAIIYYSPQAAKNYELKDGLGGVVHALGVDPEAELQPLFAVAASIALSSTGLGSTTNLLLTDRPSDAEGLAEHNARVRATVAVEAMDIASKALPAGSLDSMVRSTSANLRRIWPKLSDECRTMLVTAEYFGTTAPEGADLSGPLLGLAATAERYLNEVLVDPARVAHPGKIQKGQTFGSTLRDLDSALHGSKEPAAAALRAFLDSHPTADVAQLRAIMTDAKAMNRKFRIPAAHAELVDVDTWARGRESIIDPGQGLLPRFVTALSGEG